MWEQQKKVTLGERMVRAARLDPHLYEEVEADRSLTGQAAMVVVLAAVATGIGFTGIVSADEERDIVASLLLTIVSSLLGWVVLAWLTYYIGTRLLPEPQTHADWGQLARPLAFAQSPGVLMVFGVIPGIGPLIFLVAGIWQFIARIIAVRQALDYQSTWRAAGVVLIGTLILNLVFSLLLRGF